ncbi:MAG TPA: hypothetical protein VNL17_13125, partial [Verrucomicrobiae bacterium]|nr:hypothetical protein [Verrucomicrobiae bacterium]
QTVANHGTIMAANPVAGLNVFSVGMSDFNDATLGASNGAILNLVLGGGAGSSFNNNGTIAMLGGTLVISNGAHGVITNDLFVTGSGTITPAIVNDTSATILASNGVLTIGLFNNLNSGTLHNFDGGSSINLTNAVLVNTGTIALGGGGLIMAGVITNENAITGPGALGASLLNDTTGTLLATNGTLTVGTNTGAFVINRGVATISSSGVLSVTPSWLNTNGIIQLAGGVVSGGALTNKGTITGFGAFSNTIYNATGGTINVASGNTLQIVPAWNNASGTVNMLGGMLAGGAVTNLSLINGFGTISSRVVNNSGGILTATGGILTLSNAPTQNGTFIVTNTGTLNVVAAWNNNGTISLRGGTVIGGTLTNLNQVTGFGTLTSLLVNGAGSTLTAAGGTLTLALAPVQNGTIVITNSGTLDVATAWQNSGTVSLMGGTLVDGTLTNLDGGRVLGYGTVAAGLINSGTLLASSSAADLHLTGGTVFNQTNGVFGANNGRLIVDAVFTNAGTVSFINSVGTFASAVVNKGTWVMNPSTNVFLANYTVATNGYVSMSSGGVSIFKNNFVNVSTLSNQYNTLNGKFVMDGQGTQQFFVAGINLGGYASSAQPSNETFFTTANGTFSTNAFAFGTNDMIFGYSNNFALGTLELSGLSTTVVMDAFGTVGTNDGLVAGLYLNTLTLDPGSLLIISNNVELYFQSTNGVTGVGLGVLGAGDNILILSGGSLHQIGIIPEPSVLMLLAIGAFIIHKYRHRS